MFYGLADDPAVDRNWVGMPHAGVAENLAFAAELSPACSRTLPPQYENSREFGETHARRILAIMRCLAGIDWGINCTAACHKISSTRRVFMAIWSDSFWYMPTLTMSPDLMLPKAYWKAVRSSSSEPHLREAARIL